MSSSSKELIQAADSIAFHADNLGAGRVTFRDSSGFLFSGPTREDIMEFLRSHEVQKYKLQRKGSNGRWKDISKYFPIPGANLFLELLHKPDFTSKRQFTNDEINRAALGDPSGYRLALRRIFGKIAVAPRLRELQQWSGYLGRMAQHPDQLDFAFLKATVDLLEQVLGEGVDDELNLEGVERALLRLDGNREYYAENATGTAFSVVEGKLLSFLDRSAASSTFQKASSNDKNGLIDSFYFDVGVHTYFADFGEEDKQHAIEIQESIKQYSADIKNENLAVAVSVDPHFFRIYGPQLFLFAQQLPQLDFVFILCGDQNDVDVALADGDDYLKQLSSLNQSGYPKNIQYLYMPVPAWVRQPKTFYACARFFAATHLLARYKQVYLMDADLFAEDDPTRYFKKISGVSFGTATKIDITRLSPWRRYLAGNVALSYGHETKQLLDDLLGYISHGLKREQSWMLDQNALAFIIEKYPHLYTSLDEFWRPFIQPKFRATWERRHFAITKTL